MAIEFRSDNKLVQRQFCLDSAYDFKNETCSILQAATVLEKSQHYLCRWNVPGIRTSSVRLFILGERNCEKM